MIAADSDGGAVIAPASLAVPVAEARIDVQSCPRP
jgi:hypothetical protein